MPEAAKLVEMTAEIVSAYVAKSNVPPPELPALIKQVHTALSTLGTELAPQAEPQPLVPAVPIKKSLTPDYLVCLEDGKRFKSLKRHLRTRYNLSPDEYRVKWGLPRDYPMVAPNYAAARSVLAKEMGLGQARKAPAPPPPSTRRRRRSASGSSGDAPV